MIENTTDPHDDQPVQADERDTPGRVVSASGSVVDVAFRGKLPPMNHALNAEWDGRHRLVLEVRQHLDHHTIRAVAMQEIAGLRSGVRRVGMTALTVAEHFRDEISRNVLLLIDNAFRFVQAGSEVPGRLGRLPAPPAPGSPPGTT